MEFVKKNKLVLIVLFLFIIVTGYLLFELQNVRSELRAVQDVNDSQQQQDSQDQDMSDDDEFERALNQDISDEEEGIKAVESYILSQMPTLRVAGEPVEAEIRICQIDYCNTPEAMQDDRNYVIIPAEQVTFLATQGEEPVGSPVESDQFREALESYGFVLEEGGSVDAGIHYYEYSRGTTRCAVNYGGAYENEIILRCGEMKQLSGQLPPQEFSNAIDITGSITKLDNIGILEQIDDQQYNQGRVAYYEAGTIESGEFQGYKRIIVLQQGQVNTYSVLYTKDFEKFIFIDGKDLVYSVGNMNTGKNEQSTYKEIVEASIEQTGKLDNFPRNIIFDDYVLVRDRLLYSVSGDLELFDNSDASKEEFRIEGLSMIADYQDGIVPENYNEDGLIREENGVGLVDETGLSYRYKKVTKE